MSQQMIPLHIADLAVRNVEADLAKVKAERDQLKAEVERLTKAGDAMADTLSKELGNTDPDVRAWNAAKGVQS